LNSIDEIVKLRNNSTIDKIRQTSAMDILDRAGYKEEERVSASVTVVMSEEKAGRIAEELKRMRK